jgi:adenylyltransferase/sulfurtransferase
MNTSLSKEEQTRYSRTLSLKGFGEEAQLNLKHASVLVVGAGGLGCPSLLYLTTAGVGKIGIADGDVVSLSNLQRQVLYDINHVGQKKAEIAKRILTKKNPTVNIQIYPDFITPENCLPIAENYDIIIDASDNFETRYLLNDACVILNKPLIYAALHEFEGQISVFNHKNGPTLRCLFPEIPKKGTINNCADTGVLSVLPGLIGVWQAQEAIKIITGIGEVLNGKLLIYNSLNNEVDTISFKLNEANKQFRNLNHFLNNKYEEIDASTLNKLLEKDNIQIVDVREPDEFDVENVGGLNIPLVELSHRFKELNSGKRTVVICQSGKRSLVAVDLIIQQYPDIEISHLKGGLNSYLL